MNGIKEMWELYTITNGAEKENKWHKKGKV
jgi:hypothetical protein